MAESNIFDVQASEPYDYKDHKTGEMRRVTPSHVNRRLHVLTSSMERAIELMHIHHPEAVLHQVIKRNSVSDVIVDPDIFPSLDEQIIALGGVENPEDGGT